MYCAKCAKRISKDEVRIYIPDHTDISATGHFHRDCCIEEEVGEDGCLFEENVNRIFAIFKSVLTDWCSPGMVEISMLPQINAAAAQLNKDVRDWLKTLGEEELAKSRKDYQEDCELPIQVVQ